MIYNILGGVGWITSMLLAGYWLGQIPWIRDHFEMVVIGIVLVSVLPMVGGVFNHWRKKNWRVPQRPAPPPTSRTRLRRSLRA